MMAMSPAYYPSSCPPPIIRCYAEAMDPNITALERAFQLAKSGAFTSVHAIKQQLSAEGFAAAQVTGKTLAKQLNALIKAAREGTQI
jgi:hypothetical protein